MKKLTVLILTFALVLAMFTGCSEALGEIAGNVAETAKQELENQVKATFQKYKMDILELKTTAGKLNGTSGDFQFFCAVLVQSDSDAVPQSVADALGKLFHDAGVTIQTGNQIESDYLEHRELSYKFTAFEEGKTYYTVYCYTDRLPSLTSGETSPGVG